MGLTRLISHLIRRIAPINISSIPYNSSVTGSSTASISRLIRRRSRAKRIREISRHHQALAELYIEEADKLDDDLSLE